MVDAEAHILSLVDAESVRVADPARRGALQAMLQDPARVSLAWDYGYAGERFNCWLVGRSPYPDRPWLLVYCDRGFGPASPWGFVFADEDSIGMDCQWHSGLEKAAIVAGLLPAPADDQEPGSRPLAGVG